VPIIAVGRISVAGVEHELGSITLLWRAREPEVTGDDLAPFSVLGATLVSTVTRVEAEVAAHTSEERYRTLAEHSSDLVIVYDDTATIVYMNPPAARFTGLTPGEQFGRSNRLVHPDDLPVLQAQFGRLARAGTGSSSEPFELRVRRRDDQYRWLELIATHLLDDPIVRGVVINARDVTDRREALASLAEANESLRQSNEALTSSELRFRALVQNVAEGIIVIGADGEVRYSSPATGRMLGYNGDSGAGTDPLEMVHPDDSEAVAELLAVALAEPGIHGPLSLRVRAADGSWRHLEAIGNNLLDELSVQGVVITTRDVTERVRAEEALRHTDERIAALVENLSDVITIVGPDGQLVYSSPAAERLFGFVEGDESWTDPMARVHPDDVERVVEEFTAQLSGGGAPVRFRLRVADGSWRDVEALLRDLSHDPAVGGIVVTTRDVTDRTRAESLVRDQARVLRLIAQGAALPDTLATMCEVVEANVPDGICSVLLVDEAAQVLRTGAGPRLPVGYASQVAEIPIGPDEGSCGAAAHLGESVIVADVTADPRWKRYADAAVAHGLRACWSTPIVASTGDRVLGTFAVYFDTVRRPSVAEQEVVAMITALGAIAIERKGAEDLLAHQAHHDSLTGLPNRLLFVEFLTLALARAEREQRALAVLFLDLDRFKNINDRLGHDAGDGVLRDLARRLRRVLRPGDTVARFGGDEFTVLCDGLSAADARTQAVEVARRLLEEIEEPYFLEGESLTLSSSIGIAVAGPKDQPESLLRDADAAMYRAKELGKGRWEVFDEEMRSSVQVRLETETALYHALERSELRVHYQPIVSLPGGDCVGAEALVRWEHPERGLVTPGDFIALAEETGLIVPMGSWVIEETCRALARWQAQGGIAAPFTVAVNVSARQLAHGDLVEVVAGALARTGVDPAMLGLEITESVLMAETSVETIQSLKALGVQLSIDDFGTGYSSLGYLKRFPVDVVKVDRSFVDGLGSDPEDSAIVAAVVSLGHALGLSVVAEGVETEWQLGELVRLGCDEAQGYWFAAAGPEEEFVQRIRHLPAVPAFTSA